ncbi:S9 family peptidase [Roseofilum casamattae]|uniref:S9 family peptidase n=1 Tax=Roseofilum casamattae BLCC-M143 TaxID=3022442 RepID=A0ABT7C2X7_9CYAN|nr:S9 family peptidase [Roseofilum casamattae]MDJ1185645.1 S9 family peptidase [Roseofilum casamattae BLCC-M143]
MTQPQISPYGSWKSPITSDLIVAGTIALKGGRLDRDNLYWLEGRPSEGGRNVLVHRNSDGQTVDVTPAPYNVRTRVHEYGGASYTIADGTVYFANFKDQRLYRHQVGEEPQPLTAEGTYRYADFRVDPKRDRLIGIQEDHSSGGEPANRVVSIDLNTGNWSTLTEGHDFYASARLSPDGSQLCWISWNHPNMPWDGTELWVATIAEDGSLGEASLVAGGVTESIFQPEWSPDGTLYFVSDRSNWWNLYRYNSGAVEALCPKSAEFGLPQWVFGTSTYTFASADTIICIYSENGDDTLAQLNLQTKELTTISTPYTSLSSPQVSGNRLILSAASATQPSVLVEMDLSTQESQILHQSTQLDIDPGYLSIPEAIAFPTEDGLTAYGFYYAPQNQDYQAPAGEKPPLLVKSHGGPTAAASSSFSLKIQYWTSRGFAVLNVNYGGSTGYGRDYRQRLCDRWGIVDVDDCANGAKYLAEKGLVDSERLTISGGSAGGYTTLCALTFRDTFKAGASYYGVSDLEALATDTHKFESRYLDGLIGPYPERKDLYIERSPIHFTEKLSCPVAFFQGLEDKIVPPNQAEMMVNALREKGLPVAYVAFEGEQHGFRKAENIKRTLDGEFYFYSRVFGFKLAEEIGEIPIENLHE